MDDRIDDARPEKVRRPSKRRFEEVKVGDQLVLPPAPDWHRGVPWYFVVTDVWFDPVAGQDNPQSGEMVGVQRLGPAGDPVGSKASHSIRGLASQRYRYAEIDYVALCRTRTKAMEDGTVVGIGRGAAIRKRRPSAGR